MDEARESWPALPLQAWEETRGCLHMWTQIVGKIRLALSPALNEWWQVPLYVTPRGLGTGAIPYGRGIFELEFDLVDHQLVCRTSAGETRALALWARPTAFFYREVLGVLGSLGIDARIASDVPCEVPAPVPFSRDARAAYEPAWARRFHEVLVPVSSALGEYRADFKGKSSPVHFFWGSFDLAVTRFNGRPVPCVPGTDVITRVAYDEECISVGFWPGSDPVLEPAFYAYARPEPPGFREVDLGIAGAAWHPTLAEFVLPYERVRTAADTRGTLLAFARTAYGAAADLAGWDRPTFERPVDPCALAGAGAALH